MNIYEGARRTRTGTNHGDDGNPVPQFLVSKTYLGGKKNKGSKQSFDCYRPISIIPIFGKIFVKIIYNRL